MKYTLCITQQCNLRCTYCYIGKKNARMSLALAKDVIDFIFNKTAAGEKIHFGFFGGEPLLEFELLRTITEMAEDHPAYHKELFEMTVVSNGTIFSKEIADFLKAHDISLCISCDGPPFVQDTFRRFASGEGSSAVVERNLKTAIEMLPSVIVNAVYHPKTLLFLPQVVEYFSDLGLRQIYLSPDFSALWSKSDADRLPEIYSSVAEQYMKHYLAGRPRFISLIDSKIIVLMRGGYDPRERCRMGKGEFAFTPSGNIYPCERLIENDSGEHCIGNIRTKVHGERMSCKVAPAQEGNRECLSCGVRDYCMNWCGCSNYFSTGYYNRVGPFLCASERAAIQTAFSVFRTLERELGPTFIDHLTGTPILEGKEVERR